MASKTDPPQPATLDSVMALVQEELKAAAAREAQLTKMLEKVLKGSEASPARLAQPSPSPSPSLGIGPSATIKPVSVERPMLISSANMADFVAWEKAWHAYARCQRLDSHGMPLDSPPSDRLWMKTYDGLSEKRLFKESFIDQR